jgi:hypothetical protein
LPASLSESAAGYQQSRSGARIQPRDFTNIINIIFLHRAGHLAMRHRIDEYPKRRSSLGRGDL